MKITLSLGLALLALSSAHAQVFHSGITNAVARTPTPAPAGGGGRGDGGYHHSPATNGGHDRGYWDRGGYGWSRGYTYWGPRYGYSYVYVPTYGYYSGYGYGYPYYDNYGYYGTANSGAANGLVLGALAGGIIGNNSGEFRHNGWRGAAWGAGIGWLLGSIADANRRAAVYSAPTVVQQPMVQAQTQPAQTQQPVTIINNYYNTSTPMSAANGMFGR